MRVTSVSLYSGQVETIRFSLRDLDPTAQYFARSIVGLDSEELVPRFYGFGLQTKPKFYDFRMNSRTIVIRITLNPRFYMGESYSDIRDNVYRAISSVRTGLVTLHLNHAGATVAKISGFITKLEASHFTALPEVQLTVRCDDPMFRAINPVSYTGSEIKTTNPVIIPDSLSTAPHGFQMQLTFKAATPSFTVQDEPTNPEWRFVIIPAGGFLVGDVLYFSSEYTTKQLYMIRDGVTTYLVDKIQPESIWPIVFPGATKLHFVDIASFDWNKLEFYAAYWGV